MHTPVSRRTALLSGSLLASGLLLDTATATSARAATAPKNTATIVHGATRIAMSPNSATLASAGLDGSVRIWNAASGRAIGAPMAGHSGVVNCLAFHPDGRWLATGGSDGTLRIWDVVTRRLLVNWTPYAYASIGAVTFSPDRQTMAVGAGELVYLANIITGRVSAPLTHNPGFRTGVSGLAFSPDGRLLAGSCMNNVVQRWSPITQQRIGNPMFHSGPALDVTFSPDGRTIVSADGGPPNPVRLWSAQTGLEVRTLNLHRLPVSAVTYRPDGRLLASGSADSSVLLWNTTTGTATRRLLQGAGVSDVAISPNGRTLVACASPYIRIWDITGA